MTNKLDYDRKFDADVYDKAYFEGDGHKSGYKSYEQAKGIVQDQANIIHTVMSDRLFNTLNKDGRTPTVLDVGCAYGFALDFYNERGYEVWGFDISEHAVQQWLDRHKDSVRKAPLRYCMVGDARPVSENNAWLALEKQEIEKKKFDLVVATEFFEHIESEHVDYILEAMQRFSKWGVFCVNARTNPEQADDAIMGDHGHLNFHSMSWWIEKCSKYGQLDFDAMFDLSRLSYAYNKDVHWHNRYIVVRFD